MITSVIPDNETTSQTLIHEFHNYVSGQYSLAFVESLFTSYVGTSLRDIQVHSWPCLYIGRYCRILGGSLDSTTSNGSCWCPAQIPCRAGALDTQLLCMVAANDSHLSPENCPWPNRCLLDLEAVLLIPPQTSASDSPTWRTKASPTESSVGWFMLWRFLMGPGWSSSPAETTYLLSFPPSTCPASLTQLLLSRLWKKSLAKEPSSPTILGSPI